MPFIPSIMKIISGLKANSHTRSIICIKGALFVEVLFVEVPLPAQLSPGGTGRAHHPLAELPALLLLQVMSLLS